MMPESILNKKKILIVDDELDVLVIIEEEVFHACANCKIDKATNYENASELLRVNEYDLVVLDIMGVRGFDLLELAVAEKCKVAMLTAHALTPKALKKSHDMGAMAYLPKDKLGEIVPFLEDVLRSDHKSAWKRLLDKLGDYYDKKFGSSDWRPTPDWR
jgi:DNA-binding response OmpR family regulator